MSTIATTKTARAQTGPAFLIVRGQHAIALSSVKEAWRVSHDGGCAQLALPA